MLAVEEKALVGSSSLFSQDVLPRRISFKKYCKPDRIERPPKYVLLNPRGTKRLRELPGSISISTMPSSVPLAEYDANDPLFNNPPVTLSPPDVVRLSWPCVMPVGHGLSNCYANCFVNCVLQCIAYTPPMYNFLKGIQPAAVSTFNALTALGEVVQQIHAPRNQQRPHDVRQRHRASYVVPTPILANLRVLSKQFRLGQQSDCHEFACFLFDACQTAQLRQYSASKLDAHSAQTTPLMRIVGGYLRSRITWDRDEEVAVLRAAKKPSIATEVAMSSQRWLFSNTYEPFLILSLPITAKTLEDCLRKYCAAESIGEVNERLYETPRGVRVCAERSYTIHAPPKVLMIHLKRFDNNSMKIERRVSFNLTLNASPYCTHTARGTTYRLVGVVSHYGRSVRYGHYVAFVRGSNSLWYLCDDEDVTQCSEDDVKSAELYMAFYVENVGSAPHQSPRVAPTAPPFNMSDAYSLGVEVKATTQRAAAKVEPARRAPISTLCKRLYRPEDDTIWKSPSNAKDDTGIHPQIKSAVPVPVFAWNETLPRVNRSVEMAPNESSEKACAADNRQIALRLKQFARTAIPNSIKRKPYEGKFTRRLRDERWNEEMDRGRIKKVGKLRPRRDPEDNVFQKASDRQRANYHGPPR